MQNKKGVSPITVFFWTVVFVLLWFLFLGEWISQTGESYVVINNATGIEAMFYTNLNLLFFVVAIIFVLAYGYWGGNSR